MWIPLLLAGGVIAYVWSKREPTPAAPGGTKANGGAGNGGTVPIGGGTTDGAGTTPGTAPPPDTTKFPFGVVHTNAPRMRCGSPLGCVITHRKDAASPVVATLKVNDFVRALEVGNDGWTLVASPGVLINEEGRQTGVGPGRLDPAVHRIGYILSNRLVPGQNPVIKARQASCATAPCTLYSLPQDSAPTRQTLPVPINVRVITESPIGDTPIGWVAAEVNIDGNLVTGYMKTVSLGLTPEGYSPTGSAPGVEVANGGLTPEGYPADRTGPDTGFAHRRSPRTGQWGPHNRAVVRSSRGQAKAPMRATQSISHGPVSYIDVGHAVQLFESSRDILGRTITRARYVSPFDRSVHNGWMLEADLVRI